MWCHAYSKFNNQAHMVKYTANAAINEIDIISTVVYPNVVSVLEAFNFGAGYTRRRRPWDWRWLRSSNLYLVRKRSTL